MSHTSIEAIEKDESMERADKDAAILRLKAHSQQTVESHDHLAARLAVIGSEVVNLAEKDHSFHDMVAGWLARLAKKVG